MQENYQHVKVYNGCNVKYNSSPEGMQELPEGDIGEHHVIKYIESDAREHQQKKDEDYPVQEYCYDVTREKPFHDY